MRTVTYTNSTAIICQNPKMTAINSCIEVDITGQIVSDSIGTRMYSGKIIFSNILLKLKKKNRVRNLAGVISESVMYFNYLSLD